MRLPKQFRSLHFAVLRTIMKIIGLVLPQSKISLHRQTTMTSSHVEVVFEKKELRNHGESQIRVMDQNNNVSAYRLCQL